MTDIKTLDAVGPPEELILETVWDGRATGPHRGYLAVVPDTPRKAPPPSPEVRRRVGSVSWHPYPPMTRKPPRPGAAIEHLLSSHPDQWWTIKAVMRRTRYALSTVRDNLARLLEAGRLDIEQCDEHGHPYQYRWRVRTLP